MVKSMPSSLPPSFYPKVIQTFPPHIISDHLNSINLLHSNPSPQGLASHPARSLHQWILDIWSRLLTTPTPSRIRAHTSAKDIKSNLNRLVDHIALAAHHLPFPPPFVLVPSFFMDNFMLFSPLHGYVEFGLPSYVGSLLAKAQAVTTNASNPISL